MALEPVMVSVPLEENTEWIDMKRRFLIGALLTLPVFGLAMAAMWPGVGSFPPWATWLQMVLSTPAGGDRRC
jgi:Cu+-exporting ATPase